MHSYNLRHIIWATVETVLTSKQWISWEWCYLCWQGFSQWRVKTYFLRRGCHLFWTHNQIDAFFCGNVYMQKAEKVFLLPKRFLPSLNSEAKAVNVADVGGQIMMIFIGFGYKFLWKFHENEDNPVNDSSDQRTRESLQCRFRARSHYKIKFWSMFFKKN